MRTDSGRVRAVGGEELAELAELTGSWARMPTARWWRTPRSGERRVVKDLEAAVPERLARCLLAA